MLFTVVMEGGLCSSMKEGAGGLHLRSGVREESGVVVMGEGEATRQLGNREVVGKIGE